MHHRHASTLLLSMILSTSCFSFGYAPRFYPNRFTQRKGLSIPAAPPENIYRTEIEETLADKTSLLSRVRSFHNPVALQAIRQTEWLRHLRTTQNISPGVWDAWGYGFAERGAGHHMQVLYPLTQQDAPKLYATVAEYSHHLNLEMPMIMLVDDSKLFNAYATCMRRRSGFIIVGRGLLDATSTTELSGIIAHELGHIHHRHIPKMAGLMAGMVSGGVIALITSYIVATHCYKVSRSRFAAYALPSTLLYFGLIPLIESWVSRRYERQADSVAAQLNVNNGLAAVRAIEGYENKVFEDEMTLAQEFIKHRYADFDERTTQEYVNMLQGFKDKADSMREPSGLSKLLSSHPATSDRIAFFEDQAEQAA